MAPKNYSLPLMFVVILVKAKSENSSQDSDAPHRTSRAGEEPIIVKLPTGDGNDLSVTTQSFNDSYISETTQQLDAESNLNSNVVSNDAAAGDLLENPGESAKRGATSSEGTSQATFLSTSAQLLPLPMARKVEKFRLQLFSRIGGHPSTVNALNSLTPNGTGGPTLESLGDGPGSSTAEIIYTDSFEDKTSHVKITDVPLGEAEDINKYKQFDEKNTKIEFLFPDSAGPAGPNPNNKEDQEPPTQTTKQSFTTSPRKIPSNGKNKVHNQIIIDLETVYKGETVIANVQNGSSPFGNNLHNKDITLVDDNPAQELSIKRNHSLVGSSTPATVVIANNNGTGIVRRDKSKSHLYPFFHGQTAPSSYVNSETGERVRIPSQVYQTPELTIEDRLRLIVPPAIDSTLETAADEDEIISPTTTTSTFDNEDDPLSDAEGISFYSPLAGNKRDIVDECPRNMKCLSETYCSNANPAEGDADAFDIRLHFRKKPARQRCRQPNLPVNGYCCYLRDDFESVAQAAANVELSPRIRKRENKCGIQRPSNSGSQKSETSFGEFPWQVLVLRKDKSSCGGVILSETVVATAATCLNGTSLSDLTFRVGDWNADSLDEPKPHQDLKPQSVFIHPGFKATALYPINDIALISTKENITFDYHVSRVCLPNPIDNFDGQRCIATGWYTSIPNNSEEADFSSELKQMPITIIGRGVCERKLRETILGSRFNLHRGNICATRDAFANTCVVEPGGPIMCENSQTGAYTLAGIASWGNVCGNHDEIGVLTGTSSHAEWMYNILRKQGQGQH